MSLTQGPPPRASHRIREAQIFHPLAKRPGSKEPGQEADSREDLLETVVRTPGERDSQQCAEGDRDTLC
jgi:hypothetical protein